MGLLRIQLMMQVCPPGHEQVEAVLGHFSWISDEPYHEGPETGLSGAWPTALLTLPSD